MEDIEVTPEAETTIAVSPEMLVTTVSEGAEIYAKMTRSFVESFQFYGKTLSDWATHLLIIIPPQVEGEGFRKLLIQLANNMQIASNYHSVACSLAKAISGGGAIRKSDVCAAIVANYAIGNKKRPASAMIERMADSYMSSTVSANIASQIVREFWKQRLDALTELRKILEQIGISLHVELKFTHS